VFGRFFAPVPREYTKLHIDELLYQIPPVKTRDWKSKWKGRRNVERLEKMPLHIPVPVAIIVFTNHSGICLEVSASAEVLGWRNLLTLSIYRFTV
jgi:hypothetical protein